MSVMISPAHRDRMIQELRCRILNVLPAASYQMDRFLALTDVVYSDETETAAMAMGPQPVMLLNPDFVTEYCRRDEHLLMLVLHELYHLILGHTRLFPRATLAENIAFDAVINAMLCRQFQEPVYQEFFQDINSADTFPGCLLRPPMGWPAAMVFADAVGARERAIIRKLYDRHDGDVTYQDVLALLQNDEAGKGRDHREESDGMDRAPVLLGDHDGADGTAVEDDRAVADETMTGILRRVAADWPSQANVPLGRGDGSRIMDWLAPKPKSPKAVFLAELGALLRKACAVPPSLDVPYTWRLQPAMQTTQTVLPNLRDRQVAGRQEMLGEAPLFYTTETPTLRPRWRPREVTHVYVDISGSMHQVLPWLLSALDPLNRQGMCRLYAFSTVVDDVRRGQLRTQKIRNTGGTDIKCVYQHMLSLPRHQTPGKILVLTDGYTGTPDPADHAELLRRKVRLYVGLVGGSGLDIQKCAHHVAKLPAWR